MLFILNFREVLATSHKGLCKTTWDHKRPYTAIRDLIQQYGTLQSHKGPYGAIRYHMGPYEAMLDHTEQFGTIHHTEQYGTLRNHTGP